MFKVTDTILCVMLGSNSKARERKCVGDSKMILTRMRQEASRFKFDNGYNIPVHVLAGKLSNFCQIVSQYAFYRTPCTSTDLFTSS